MIINTNVITLFSEGSGLILGESYIGAHTSEISNNAPTSVAVRAQIGFFLTPEKMFESPKNAMKVAGFDKNYINFDYQVAFIGGHYVVDLYAFDLKVKEYIMQCFPNWDESKLLITTTPVE